MVKQIKKIMTSIMLLMLMFQAFFSPVVAVAENNDTKDDEKNSLELNQMKLIENEEDYAVVMVEMTTKNESENEQTHKLTTSLPVEVADEVEENNITTKVDEEGRKAEVTVAPETKTKFDLKLKVKKEEANEQTLVVTNDKQEKKIVIPSVATEESSEETKEKQEETEKTKEEDKQTTEDKESPKESTTETEEKATKDTKERQEDTEKTKKEDKQGAEDKESTIDTEEKETKDTKEEQENTEKVKEKEKRSTGNVTTKSTKKNSEIEFFRFQIRWNPRNLVLDTDIIGTDDDIRPDEFFVDILDGDTGEVIYENWKISWRDTTGVPTRLAPAWFGFGTANRIEVPRRSSYDFSFKNLPSGYKVIKAVANRREDGADLRLNVSIVSGPRSSRQKDVNVVKKWDDNQDQDGKRPDSVKMSLKADGKSTGKTLTLKKSDDWKGSFDNLDEYKNGKKIKYSVEEEEVDGYESEVIQKNSSKFVVTNYHEPAREIPVDPTDPDKDPEEGTEGPLSLDYASVLDFGKQKISVDNETYYAKPQQWRDKDGNLNEERTSPNFVQVTDKRAGEDGWSLTVKQNNQFTGSDNSVLEGAEISFSNGQVSSSSDYEEPGFVKEEFTLSPNGDKEKLVAAYGVHQGWGTWHYTFGDKETMDESVELFVPGSAKKSADTYKTSLIWSLSNTPGNE